jgi:hypothetical protein
MLYAFDDIGARWPKSPVRAQDAGPVLSANADTSMPIT